MVIHVINVGGYVPKEKERERENRLVIKFNIERVRSVQWLVLRVLTNFLSQECFPDIVLELAFRGALDPCALSRRMLLGLRIVSGRFYNIYSNN